MTYSDDEARVRFAWRAWAEGNTYGAPARACNDAEEMVKSIVPDGKYVEYSEFRRRAYDYLRRT